jgi:molybdate transport system substrate-binding protein
VRLPAFRRRTAGALAAVLVVAGGTGGCAGGGTGAATTVTVFAAASLTAAFKELAGELKRQRPGVRVRFNFGGSATLATQIRNGARADVFASADEQNMKKVTDAGLTATAPKIIARNELAILVPRDNPKKVTKLADVVRPGVVLALCAPEVPAGRYGREALAKAGAPAPGKGGELDVKQAVSRVTLGEADAAIAYATDARASGGKVTSIAIPKEHNVIARYPVASLKEAPAAALGSAFVTLALSDRGRAIFVRHGFLAPA